MMRYAQLLIKNGGALHLNLVNLDIATHPKTPTDTNVMCKKIQGSTIGTHNIDSTGTIGYNKQ